VSDENNVQVTFGADTGKAEGGINTIKSRLGDLSEVATKAFEANQIIEFGERLEELGHKVIEFAEKYAQMGEDVSRATKILGMSSDEFQKFAFAVKMTGGSADTAVQSMTRFEKNIGDAARGAGEAAPYFKNIGISLADLKNSSPDQIMMKVADAFHNSADGVEKTNIALAIGGRGFAQMIPVLDQGSQGLEHFNELLKETGDELTGRQVEAFEQSDEKLKLMSSAFEGVGITMFDAFRPAIDSVVDGVTSLIEGFNDSLKPGGDLREVLQGIILVLDLCIHSIDLIIQSIRTFVDVTLYGIELIDIAWDTLGRVMDDVLSGKWSKIDADYNAGLKRLEESTEKSMDRIKKHWQGFNERGKNMGEGLANFGGEGEGEGNGGKPKPKLKPPQDPNALKEAAQEAIKIKQQEIEMKRKLDDLDLANQKNALDAGVKMGLITEEQKFAMLQDFANKEYQIDLQALNEEMQVNGLKKSQYQKLLNDKLILEKKHQNDIAAIQRQAQIAEMQRYQQVFHTIDSSFKSMIQGVLQGTQTWNQALTNMFSNILVSFAGMLEEMAMKWLENQIMMAIFGQTEAMSIIAGHAAEGAAAAYASTAAIPIVGPAMAPGAAALAYANIQAFQGLASYDVGTNFVEKDQVAKIHEGERVMTKGENQIFTNVMRQAQDPTNKPSASEGDIHLHVHAIDAAGVKKFFMNNKHVVAGAVRSAARNGDSSFNHLMKA